MTQTFFIYVVSGNGYPVSSFETEADAKKYVEVISRRNIPGYALSINSVPFNMAAALANWNPEVEKEE